MKDLVKHLAAMILVIVLICLAGRHDYNDEVLYNMSEGTYEVLVEKMPGASKSEIVEAYMSDRAKWDSLGRFR